MSRRQAKRPATPPLPDCCTGDDPCEYHRGFLDGIDAARQWGLMDETLEDEDGQ